MKILLIDAEPRQANLMARVLQRLGHDVVVAVHPNDALTLVRGHIDAVITAIAMPGMTGVALARAIQLRIAHMPIGFLSSSDIKTSVLVAAAQIGPVLPELWTVTDLRELASALTTDRQTLFQTEQDEQEHWDDVDESASHGVPELIEHALGSGPMVARIVRRVRLSFRRWSQVEGLCNRWSNGPVHLSMRIGSAAKDQLVSVVMVLPDRTRMVIEGKVVDTSGDAPVVALVGLTPERIASLHVACHQLAQGTPMPERVAPERVVPARVVPARRQQHIRQDCEELKVSDIISGNLSLRSQIDGLARKLVRK